MHTIGIRTSRRLGSRIVATCLALGLVPLGAVIGLLLALDDSQDMVGRLLEDGTRGLIQSVERRLAVNRDEVRDLAEVLALFEEDQRRARLERWAVSRPSYNLVLLTDAEGRAVAAAGPTGRLGSLLGEDLSSTSWFRSAIAGPVGRVQLKEAHVDDLSNRVHGRDDALAVGMSMPIVSPDGAPVGVLHALVDFAFVEQAFAEAYTRLVTSFRTEHIELTLLDRQGRFLVDYDPVSRGSRGHARDLDVILDLNLVEMGVEIARRAVRDRGSGYLVSRHARKQVDQLGAFYASEGTDGFAGLGWAGLIRVREDALELGVSAVFWPTVALACVLACVALLGAIGLTRSVTLPVQDVLQSVRYGAEGDLRHPPETESHDEIGQMAHGFRAMLAALQARLSNVKRQGHEQSSAAGHLTDLATRMSAEADRMRAESGEASQASEQIRDRMGEVAGLIEESSRTLVSVAGAVEQLSTNLDQVSRSSAGLDDSVSTIAAALEEMNSSLGEIGQRSESTVQATSRAAGAARDIEARIRSLDARACEVDRVLHVIQDVAAQTNLLALNATIEAASAGPAGRAFSVVASEVKALSIQTARATEGVAETVTAIQTEAKEVLQATAAIVAVVEEVDSMAHEIAESVIAQGQASAEISAGVSNAAESCRFIADNVEQASTASGLVSRDAERLAASVKTVASHARTSAEEADSTAACVRALQEGLGGVSGHASSVQVAAEQVSSSARQLDELMGHYAL